jgi:quercetin dioxygenase-like cupin family protein
MMRVLIVRGCVIYISISKGPHLATNNTILCVLSWTALPANQTLHPAGCVEIGAGINADLIFTLSTVALSGAEVLATHAVSAQTGPSFLRVAEVCFPVGAIAHRHTHTGAGIRHLVRGELRIEAGGSPKVMSVGDSWFEPADTPVRAVALQPEGVTSFVRCMIVPPEFERKSTFSLVDPNDGHLPRLQMTHRHIDHAIYVDAG